MPDIEHHNPGFIRIPSAGSLTNHMLPLVRCRADDQYVSKSLRCGISFCPAVEIAALNETEQKELLVAMEYAQAIPSLSQAQRIRQLSKEKQLSLEKMEEIMCEVKKGEITRVAFTNEQLHKYFPNSYTPAMMKREILALLKLWKKESWES